MSNPALVAEVCEKDWSEESDPKINDIEEEDDEYDWSDKSNPIAEFQAEEIIQAKDVNLSVEGNKSEEVALMAQSEQIKVESSSSDSKKPSNFVPLPETVKEKLCSPECAEQIEHYRSYSFRICEKLTNEEKRHNKLKDDHKFSTEKILSIQVSWKKSLEEIELLNYQLSELSKNLELEKIIHAIAQVELTKVKSCKTMVKKMVSGRGNKNKAGLGFTHEPMPKSITNTLPNNFNTNDHSPKTKQG
ncbi:hypothetical protein QVD17_34885 [Tagetes erecta]|uniref:Uncharacterized protein n=1 Tax=Tagetes erecta TaxID=13708 RepID=A0AAD8NM33_TARER|nr:hypothetical protein QVD17_34885 [Tagetes erecta]